MIMMVMFFTFLKLYLCLSVLRLHVYMCSSGACRGTGVMDGCERPCGCWESNLDPKSALNHWTISADLMVIFLGVLCPRLSELTTVAGTW